MTRTVDNVDHGEMGADNMDQAQECACSNYSVAALLRHVTQINIHLPNDH